MLILLLPAKIMTGLKDFTEPGAPQTLDQLRSMGEVRTHSPRKGRWPQVQSEHGSRGLVAYAERQRVYGPVQARGPTVFGRVYLSCMPAGWEWLMTSIRGRYEYPDDLTPGQSKDGGLHQNLYDSQGRLVDHGTFFPDDENETVTNSPPVIVNITNEYASDSQAEEPSGEALLAALILLSAIAAAPHIKSWWNNQAFPFIKSAWKRFAGTREADSQVAAVELATFIESAPVMAVDAPPESSQEMIVALKEYRSSMSSAEARERFVAALMARLFSEEQMRLLRNARIEDLELKSAMEALTPKQIGDSIRLMLETNPSLLDELGNTIEKSSQLRVRSIENQEDQRQSTFDYTDSNLILPGVHGEDGLNDGGRAAG
jgi:hypothetical protein